MNFNKYSLSVTILLSLCVGILTVKNSLHIVGGDEVVPHSYPFMVAIKTTINEIPVLCGGTLIAENIVLTAAKCVEGASTVDLVFGAHNISETEASQIVLTSSEFIIHEEYNETTKTNDIALIKLSTPVELSDNVAIVPIPTIADITKTYDEELGVVIGWGKENDTVSTYSKVLRKMEVTIIPFLSCDLAYLFSLNLSQMCTTGTMGMGICLGDNGGPLLANGTQVGIASFGNDFACSAGFPSVYTRLTSYVLWIDTHLNSNK